MLNFHRAAYSYLEDWVLKDRGFNDTLGFRRSYQPTDAEAAACLNKVANHYGVARTLRRIDEAPRLIAAYRLMAQTAPPEGDEEAASQVVALASALKGAYGKLLLSAASKFLWIRFRSPVVIYDQLVVSYLVRECKYRDDDYLKYCHIWKDEFRKYELEIRAVCAELPAIKRFTVARDEKDQDILNWTTSQWFVERVFDYAMLNDATDRQP